MPADQGAAGGEALFYYGKGKVGNARDLNYQAVIDKQSRNCVVSNGLITVKMGVVGRVLLGPSGQPDRASICRSASPSSATTCRCSPKSTRCR